ncbi:unnamed protein product [Trypanosoma congolense IL3000]|uniref:WGS project CAEQ00000000 data, annotated contig 1023 n=1 Tax=Trypanosoma congolense (strain IL3000) TaxID=1068625 RepID=F9W3A0_TRYCI|nr:unnamed protein product [Trypanosoma congolense IL3000]
MEERGVRRTRDEMEGESDAADAAASHETLVRARTTWTLDSPVEEVLLCNYGGLSDMSLHDFLMEHFGETFGSPNVSMSVFVGNPSFFLRDESLLIAITCSQPYREFVREYRKEYAAMDEGVNSCRNMGIFSLRQWSAAAAADKVGKFKACVMVKLNAALFSVRRNADAMKSINAQKGTVADDLYDSVFNARWSYVVRSNEFGRKWLGMGVLSVTPGEQPHLWSEAQANAPYDPVKSWEGDEVPGVRGKLVMMVLSSPKGWPCLLFRENGIQMKAARSLTCYNAEGDAYIRKENLRVWHIVRRELDRWLGGNEIVRPFIVIGTPGIGKSFATGSLLLYQLLRYPSYDLKVVAYFVREKAYIFHREERRVVYYDEQCLAMHEIEDMIRRGIKGYIIFDIWEECIGIGSFSRAWGIILISYPCVKNFQKFTILRQDTLPIYINCHEDVEFKALLVCERNSQLVKNQIKLQDVNIANDWEVTKKRIDMVGPVPRYVLSDGWRYRQRYADVDNELSCISYVNIERNAYLSFSKEGWYADKTRRMEKLVRVQGVWPEEARNEAVSAHLRGGVLGYATKMSALDELYGNNRASREERRVSMFKVSGLHTFMIGSVVTKMVRYLKYLPREGETEKSRSTVLRRPAARGRVPISPHHFSSADTPVEIVVWCLYKPVENDFPVVDGFFLVDAVGKGVLLPEGAAAPTQTIVLLQVTKAGCHHTTTSEVGRFRELMAQSFTNWREMENRLSYEMIYVQHTDSTSITDRQRCDRSGMADDTVIEEFWNRISHFQVNLEAPITKLLCKRSTMSKRWRS